MFNKINISYKKKYLTYFFITAIALSAIGVSGCIFDSVDQISQEVPYTFDISISGTETNTEQSRTVNLDEADFYSKNKDNINKIEFVKIAYSTKSVTPANLSANITLTVKQSNGIVLFSKSIPGASPAAYLTNPYEITISQAEIQAVNAYLSIISNRVFTATVKVENATPGNKTIEAQIHVVFKMEGES